VKTNINAELLNSRTPIVILTSVLGFLA
jgi:hypothetical protein